jgi:hypothetical protein
MLNEADNWPELSSINICHGCTRGEGNTIQIQRNEHLRHKMRMSGKEECKKESDLPPAGRKR